MASEPRYHTTASLVGGNLDYRPVWHSLDEPCSTIGVAPFYRPGGVGWVLDMTTRLIDDGQQVAPTVVRSNKPPYRIPSMTEIAELRGSNGLTAVSTFSGCGGSCLGLEWAGYRVAWASEFVPAAAEVYRLNHPGVYLDTSDIRTVRPKELLAEAGLRQGEADLFEGSPPCSSFSMAGARSRKWGASLSLQ